MRIALILLVMATSRLFAQSAQKDTTFIVNETIDGERHAIFIDNNQKSEYYAAISNFNFQQFDDESYKRSTDYLSENKLSLTKAKPVVPWRDWVTLKQYDSKFYAYYPCDFLFHFRQSINDSTFIDWTGEGPEANKIIHQRKIDKNTYEMKLSGISYADRKITIHIIDPKKGIAVFEQTSTGTDKKYYLMISAPDITSVPIIVNVCPTQKQMELKFEDPDFEKLLEK